ATELLERFTPLAEYLGRELGRAVIVRVGRDYQDHIDRVGRDDADIAYMGPAPYVKMVKAYGKKRILARLEIAGSGTYRGVIVVREESPLKNLSELEGKRFAFGDPDSTMSHLVPRYMLWEAGVGVEKLAGHEHIHNHRNVALGVLLGDFDAGAMREDVFLREYGERGLRVLAKTPPISKHVFVASNELPQETVRALKEALYGMEGDGEGRAAMSAINEDMTALVPGRDEDFENLRKMLRALEALGVRP
ncbi:MAG: phosphate/phosphite/phosphonate ABC transporter substrate-binding protein, partial [Nitrospirota bacterium]